MKVIHQDKTPVYGERQKQNPRGLYKKCEEKGSECSNS
jgi:hypothetical protein